jgi:hypothetical protein
MFLVNCSPYRSRDQVITPSTIRPIAPLWFRLSRARNWESALDIGKESYGWKTPEVLVSGQPLVSFGMIAEFEPYRPI